MRVQLLSQVQPNSYIRQMERERESERERGVRDEIYTDTFVQPKGPRVRGIYLAFDDALRGECGGWGLG